MLLLLLFFQSTRSILTRESDVESLIGHREVREEAYLSRVVSKQACAEWRRKCWAGQSPQRLSEAAVLCHQQMVMRAFEVESVECELDTWVTGRGAGPSRDRLFKNRGNDSGNLKFNCKLCWHKFSSTNLCHVTSRLSMCSWGCEGKSLENQVTEWCRSYPGYNRRTVLTNGNKPETDEVEKWEKSRRDKFREGRDVRNKTFPLNKKVKYISARRP